LSVVDGFSLANELGRQDHRVAGRVAHEVTVGAARGAADALQRGLKALESDAVAPDGQ